MDIRAYQPYTLARPRPSSNPLAVQTPRQPLYYHTNLTLSSAQLPNSYPHTQNKDMKMSLLRYLIGILSCIDTYKPIIF